VGVAGWKPTGAVVVTVERESDLLEIIGTLNPRCRGSDFLNGRHKQADQDANDRDHHQEFDQGKGTSRAHIQTVPLNRGWSPRVVVEGWRGRAPRPWRGIAARPLVASTKDSPWERDDRLVIRPESERARAGASTDTGGRVPC
jgi:hypothetical protein